MLIAGLAGCAQPAGSPVWKAPAGSQAAALPPGAAPGGLLPAASTPAASAATTAVRPPGSPSPTAALSSTRAPTRPASATPRPSASPTPTRPACLAQGGTIETSSLTTALLRSPLVYRVYLPPCYRQESDRRYPVLYLFHGQGFTDEQWDRIGADETADRLIAAGEIPPLIIVMPWERYGGQPTQTKFSQAVTELLLPRIDQLYRTIPDREHRAAGGLSRGGGWAVHFGIGHAELFGSLGAHSVAVFHADAQLMRTWLKSLGPQGTPRIYVDIGDRDRPEIMDSAVWFSDLLNEFSVPYEWRLFRGYHNEAYWSAHMEDYLRWYTAGW